MTCTPREKGGEEGFDPSQLTSWTSILLVTLACWNTSFPTPFPTFIVVRVSVSHGLQALSNIKLGRMSSVAQVVRNWRG